MGEQGNKMNLFSRKEKVEWSTALLLVEHTNQLRTLEHGLERTSEQVVSLVRNTNNQLDALVAKLMEKLSESEARITDLEKMLLTGSGESGAKTLNQETQ